MRTNFTLSLRGWKESHGLLRIFLVIFMLLSLAKGLNEEKTPLSSSQKTLDKTNIEIKISESVKGTKTIDQNIVFTANTTNKVAPILSTKILENSSYLESKVRNIKMASQKPTQEDVTEKTHLRATQKIETENVKAGEYFETIKPTRAKKEMEMKIAQTIISPGEVEGVSMGVITNKSGPQKSSSAMSFNRPKRGFVSSLEDSENDRIKNYKDQKFNESIRKKEKNKTGRSYNQIEENLSKIAKVTVSSDSNETIKSSPTLTSSNFRVSREEENRKAGSDIQDIITGIVNILNGKGTKQMDSGKPRPPRPSGTRINNRGPPRIADVPPLDFDGPPSYRPLPPPPPKRIPPPYPFDRPQSMPSIPLPPQPQTPSTSKLPSHPFIEGVPIPEFVIPDRPTSRPLYNRPPENIHLEYDTISMSEPMDTHNFPSAIQYNTSSRPQISLTMVEATTRRTSFLSTKFPPIGQDNFNHFNSSTSNIPKAPVNNSYAAAESNKVKQSEPKLQFGVNSVTKISDNEQVGSSNTKTQLDTTESPQSSEPVTIIFKETNNKTKAPVKLIETMIDNNSNVSNTQIKDKVPIQTTTNQPVQRDTSDSTTEIDEPFKPSSNISLLFDTKESVEVPEIEINKTKSTAQIKTTSTEVVPIKKGTEIVRLQNDTDKIELELELPVLLEPSDGIGEATPILESSIPDFSYLPNYQTKVPTASLTPSRTSQQPTIKETSHPYKARPGIVLDDPEFKPGVHKRPVITAPIITTPPTHKHYGEIFDVTVHAIQGPGEKASTGKPFLVPVDMDEILLQNSHGINSDVAVITKPEEGQNFVSIDGKRTYINLFGEVSSTQINPTTTQPAIIGTGYVIPHKESPVHQPLPTRPISTPPPRRTYKRPSHPPVRIDTCIVGDDSTCDLSQNEICKTEDGVSSCHCRPGYNRKKHRDSCRRVVSMITSMRVDKLYDKRIKWQDNLRDPDSEDYQQLSYEASQAIESAMSMTPFSDDFINSRINSIYVAKNLENNEPAVYVNITLQLEENLDTLRPAVKQDIQRHLIRVIQRRNNNVGNSAVWVDAPPGSILALQDVDECSSTELHDCHERAFCYNTFGGFKCQCPEGLRDPWLGNVHREGRFCESCPSDYCNNRGECKFEHGQQACHCSGNFYGAQCEIDGEVLGVAIGASVAAAIIIILTLVCLCMWSRRWSREQKSAVGMGSPVFGYMATGPTVKTPSVGGPPYQVSIEDRIRWAQIADVMAKANHYAQPEPVNTKTRPSFGGYPTLPSHNMSIQGTLPVPALAPPVPLPRLTLTNKSQMGTYGAHSQIGSVHQSSHGLRSSVETTSSSEEEDRTDLLGRNFNVPRPKSRTSLANQSGIYYDVDYDRSDLYSKQNTIPMNTYTLNPQHQVRPYFR